MKRIMAFAMAFMMIGIIISCPLNLIAFAADDSYKSWKQDDERWRDTPTGGTDTLWHYGCLVTSCAMLMVKSGAEPNDVNQFKLLVLIPFSAHHCGTVSHLPAVFELFLPFPQAYILFYCCNR